MASPLHSVRTDRRATTTFDYALIAAITGLALTAALQPVGVSIGGVFAELSTGIAHNVVEYRPYQQQP